MTEPSTTRRPSTPSTRSSRIDHRHAVGATPHLAGAERMMNGDGVGADMGVEIGIRDCAVAGRDLARDERAQRRLAADIARHAQAAPQRLPVVVGGKEILPDAQRPLSDRSRRARPARGFPAAAPRRGRHSRRRKAAGTARRYGVAVSGAALKMSWMSGSSTSGRLFRNAIRPAGKSVAMPLPNK